MTDKLAGDYTLKPNLNYNWLHRDGDGVVGDGPPLADVSEVTVYWDGDFYARGRMLCKDGHSGPSRSLKVDLMTQQPEWLQAIIVDAQKRGF